MTAFLIVLVAMGAFSVGVVFGAMLTGGDHDDGHR